MKVSIIIPTYNEEKYLPKLLKSIKNQDFNNYELIVSDSNSKDRTVEIAKQFGCKIVLGGLPAFGRNQGAKYAKGDLFIFFDADTVIPSGFLKRWIEEFERRNLDVAGVNLSPITKGFLDNFLHDSYNLWQIVMQRIDPYMSGAGIFVKKNVFFSLNGFDEDLIVAEDHAFARKSKKEGYKFRILRGKIYLDMRRLRNEGRFFFALKLFFFMFKRFFGEVRQSRISYDLRYRK